MILSSWACSPNSFPVPVSLSTGYLRHPMDPWVFTVSPVSSSGYPIPQPMAKEMSFTRCWWFMSIIAAFGFLPLVGKQLIPPCWQANIFVCSLGGNKYQLPAKSNNPIKVQPTFPPNVASTSPFFSFASRNPNHSPTIHQPNFRGSWVAWQRSSTPAGPNRPHLRNRWPRSVPHALPGDLEMCLAVAGKWLVGALLCYKWI